MITVAVAVQAFWERYDGYILFVLAAAWVLLAVHIGAQRARP